MRLGNHGLAVDSAAEENGRWVKAPAEWGDVDLLICGTESHAYRAAEREKKLDRMTPDQRLVALSELIAEHLIKGWRGLIDAHGQPVEFSAAGCRAICLNRDNRRLIEFVYGKASDLRTFNVEDDAKN